jgi:hypothetical protein
MRAGHFEIGATRQAPVTLAPLAGISGRHPYPGSPRHSVKAPISRWPKRHAGAPFCSGAERYLSPRSSAQRGRRRLPALIGPCRAVAQAALRSQRGSSRSDSAGPRASSTATSAGRTWSARMCSSPALASRSARKEDRGAVLLRGVLRDRSLSGLIGLAGSGCRGPHR